MKTAHRPMRTVWHSLLWKEWHEHKWKLVALTPTIFVVPLSFLSLDNTNPFGIFSVMSGSIIVYGILAGLFTGMGTAASENQRGTMQFLQTLPIPMQQPAAVKLLMSLFTVTVPVLLLVGVVFASCLWIPPDKELLEEALKWSGDPFGDWGSVSLSEWCTVHALAGTVFVSSFLLWMAAAGVNRSDEIRAGAIGFLAIIIFWGVLLAATDRADRANFHTLKQCLAVPTATAAGAPAHAKALSREYNIPLPILVASALFGHGCLGYWFLRRFGCNTVRPARTLGGFTINLPRTQWLAQPRRNQLSAIIWKQVHETAPLALIAAAAVMAFACLVYWAQDRRSPDSQLGAIMAQITISMGFLVTIVAGMGVFLEDMKPQVGAFWRSRPINLSLWFATKFLTGLLVLTLTFGALLLLSFWLLDSEYRRIDTQTEHFEIIVASMSLIFVLIYTLAMASYCLTRHPVIAAMATIILFCLGGWTAIFVSEKYLNLDAYPVLGLAVLLVIQGIIITVAWLAVRNNWGWHK